MVHDYNPSVGEAETCGLLHLGGGILPYSMSSRPVRNKVDNT